VFTARSANNRASVAAWFNGANSVLVDLIVETAFRCLSSLRQPLVDTLQRSVGNQDTLF
jgi:hypothetical protein